MLYDLSSRHVSSIMFQPSKLHGDVKSVKKFGKSNQVFPILALVALAAILFSLPCYFVINS